MKAMDLLKSQHGLVKQLFARIETARGADKVALFEELAANLVAHDVIEREIFYPACEAVLGEAVLGEPTVEHGVIQFCLLRADLHREGTDFDSYVTVLKEMVEHHVEEEEDELFRKAKRALDEDRQQELGKQMERRFDKALQSDFRKSLGGDVDKAIQPGRRRASSKPTTSKRATPPKKAAARGRAPSSANAVR